MQTNLIVFYFHKPDTKTSKKEAKEPVQVAAPKTDKNNENADSDEDDEYNVANENMVTKLTKAKKKKINQEKTVVIEENYVITARVQSPPDPATPETSLIAKNEDSNTTIDNLTKMTIETSSVNGRATRLEEIVVKKENQQQQSSMPKTANSSTQEKFKPEETIQYEYEQVIEQPELLSKPRTSDSSSLGKDNTRTQLENTTKKTTKQQTNEKYEHVENVRQDKIKTTTTDMTTFITEEEEDQLVEILEKTTDTQEFTYQHVKHKPMLDSATDLDTSSNLASVVEQLNSTTESDERQATLVATGLGNANWIHSTCFSMYLAMLILIKTTES